MKVLLDNVNLSSTSGPNHFGNKLRTALNDLGHQCDTALPEPDVQLSFIETHVTSPPAPLVLRLDGIYFDTAADFVSQNKNILRCYLQALGVVFQSEYCKELIFRFFGAHDNYQIIHNGADLEYIESVDPMQNELTERFDNIWCCASSWYYNNNPQTPRRWKRLQQNVEFFKRYAASNDCLIVAGNVAPADRSQDDRIFYVGRLEPIDLFSLYKAAKYFIHLASPDACPNVVVDARASGCQVVCSSLGGAKEIAGPNALVVTEERWDYTPMELNGDRLLDLTNITKNCYNAEMDMRQTARKYESFLMTTIGK